MSELVVVAVITSKPGEDAPVRDALAALVPPTRAESGCRSYALYESAVEPGTFVTVETWDGQSDLDAHMASDHIATALAAAGSHLAAPPAIHPLVPIDAG